MSAAAGRVDLNFKVHSAQAEFIRAPARYRVLCWGRRAGKNVGAGIDVVDYALNPASDPYGSDRAPEIWWVAPTYGQANEYGFEIVDELLPKALLDGDPKRSKPRKHFLEGGAEISYRSADNPDSLDGAGVDRLVLDEAAIIPPDIYRKTLRPMLSDYRGRATFISKPKGQNWFHDYFKRGQSAEDAWDDWWSSQQTAYVNPWVADSEIDDAAAELPKHVFQQEYLAVFHSDEGGVFKKVRERAVEDYDWKAQNGNGPYRIGVDFARWQNWTVIVTLDRDDRLVDFRRMQETTWDRIQKEIEAAYARYPGEIRLDASRDEKVVEDLENQGLPVEAVTFGHKKKREMIDNLAVSIENGEITIPEIPTLVNELQLFEYEISNRSVSYSAPPGWNDDCVDALALAHKRSETASRGTWGSGSDPGRSGSRSRA